MLASLVRCEFTPDTFLVGAHENTITVIAVVELDDIDTRNGTLVAYVETEASREIRGVQANALLAPFGPYSGRWMYHLMVYGDLHGDNISFVWCYNGGEWFLDVQIVFMPNGSHGTLLDPILLQSN